MTPTSRRRDGGLSPMTATRGRRTVLAGLASILASGSAPAIARQRRVHWLKWVDFMPEGDALLRDHLLPQAEKELGLAIVLETVNGNDLPPRIAGALRAGAGPDIVMAFDDLPRREAGRVADLGDLADEIARRDGGFYPWVPPLVGHGGRFAGLPWTAIGSLMAWRRSLLPEGTAPADWESFRAVGRALKVRGHPVGQSLGPSGGDPAAFAYPLLWSWGGRDVAADGRSVVLGSRETIESVRFLQALWQEAFDPAGLDWTDTSNNRAFLAGTLSATVNNASIWIDARRAPGRYRTASGTPLYEDIVHVPLPRGPAGAFALPLLQSNMVMGYSPNQEAATALLRWLHAPANYGRFAAAQAGFSTPCTTVWESASFWADTPAMAPFRLAARLGGAPGRDRSIVPQMYARAVRGQPAAEAVAWAEARLRAVYAG